MNGLTVASVDERCLNDKVMFQRSEEQIRIACVGCELVYVVWNKEEWPNSTQVRSQVGPIPPSRLL